MKKRHGQALKSKKGKITETESTREGEYCISDMECDTHCGKENTKDTNNE